MTTDRACNSPICNCRECTGDRACTAEVHIEGCFATEVAYYNRQPEYQTCPVCQGRCAVPHGFYNTSPAFGSTSTADEQCRLCRGRGVILRPGQSEPTPQGRKGMFRTRGDSLLSQCIYLFEQMYMESLNGVLCQVPDEERRDGPCAGCAKMWAELKALMERYDAGER